MHDGVLQPAGVTVTVPARLHLGFLDLNGGLGRRFGSIGLAISDLKTSLTVRHANGSEACSPESERARQYLKGMEQALALPGTHAVSVMHTVPAHAGFGSGTQLALATAAALRRLHNLPLEIERDAAALGRGTRSGIGVGLFHRGGLVVDGGHGAGSQPAPIVCRLPFPDRWRILLILDRQRQGLHGADEAAAFATLAPMRESDADRICRLVLMKALPALAEHDIGDFGAAINELQARLGGYFATAQGGSSYSSPAVAAVLKALDGSGAHGIGQSSWGPTGFAFASSGDDANRLATLAREHSSGHGLDIRICTGINHGAEIVAQAHAPRFNR